LECTYGREGGELIVNVLGGTDEEYTTNDIASSSFFRVL
jgi:hypothetical protein